MSSVSLQNANSVSLNLANEKPSTSSEWKKAHLILIRHGLSEHNRAAQIVNENGTISYNFRYNSNPEHPNYRPSNLLEEGKVTLIETAKKLHSMGVHAINTTAYVSPLPRTQQSAEILIRHGVIGEAYTTDNRIIEAQAGELEGEFGLYPEVSREDKNAKKYESRELLAKRIKEFVLTLQDSLSRTDTKNIVIVSHGGVLARMVQIFDPTAQIAMTPGSYLEYDLSFNPTTPKEVGKLTPAKM
jgi:broad specificity phosphatase PhoE